MLFIDSDSYSAFVFQAQSSVAANILGSLCALVGFILLSVNLAALDPAFWKCALNKEDQVPVEYHFYNYVHPYVKKYCFKAKTILAVSTFRLVFQSYEISEILDFRYVFF